ncbi:hypothetical protein [Winogradskya humida]|uniref:hypothetical protein n=1 Tax=Winogradskya humida TaxID=113566 RepID=UPI0019405E0A|nr:hypothetical protein [Actinoplanes humidus]
MIELSTVLVLAGVVFIVCGLGVVVVQLRRGDTGFGLLRGESVETRRAVRRAIRDGETDDARVDELARQTFRMIPRLRWARYFFAGMFVLSIILLAVGDHTAGDTVLRVSQALLWAGLIVLDGVNRRRRDNYRGLRPTP